MLKMSSNLDVQADYIDQEESENHLEDAWCTLHEQDVQDSLNFGSAEKVTTKEHPLTVFVEKIAFAKTDCPGKLTSVHEHNDVEISLVEKDHDEDAKHVAGDTLCTNFSEGSEGKQNIVLNNDHCNGETDSGLLGANTAQTDIVSQQIELQVTRLPIPEDPSEDRPIDTTKPVYATNITRSSDSDVYFKIWNQPGRKSNFLSHLSNSKFKPREHRRPGANSKSSELDKYVNEYAQQDRKTDNGAKCDNVEADKVTQNDAGDKIKRNPRVVRRRGGRSESSVVEEIPDAKDDLESLAMEELLKEAKRGAERSESMGPYGWVKPNKSNKRFLTNTLMSTLRKPFSSSERGQYDAEQKRHNYGNQGSHWRKHGDEANDRDRGKELSRDRSEERNRDKYRRGDRNRERNRPKEKNRYRSRSPPATLSKTGDDKLKKHNFYYYYMPEDEIKRKLEKKKKLALDEQQDAGVAGKKRDTFYSDNDPRSENKNSSKKKRKNKHRKKKHKKYKKSEKSRSDSSDNTDSDNSNSGLSGDESKDKRHTSKHKSKKRKCSRKREHSNLDTHRRTSNEHSHHEKKRKKQKHRNDSPPDRKDSEADSWDSWDASNYKEGTRIDKSY